MRIRWDPMRTRLAFGAMLFALVVGCGLLSSLHLSAARPGSSVAAAGAGPAAPSGAASAGEAAGVPLGSPPDSLWHESYLLRDITAAGRPDSLALTAVGADIDRLVMTFEVWSGGERIFSDSWPSALYFRYTYPPREGRIELAEQRWREFFADSAFQDASTIESDPPRGMESGGPRHYIAFRLAFEATLDSLLGAGVDPGRARGQARQVGWAMPHDDPRVVGIWDDIRTADPTTFTYFRGGEDTQMIAWSPDERRFFIVYSCC